MGAGNHHHHHGHAHGATRDHGPRLVAALALVLAYMVAEVVGGLLSGSLALLADAGHMLSDAGALVVSLLALRIARRPPSATHTFGYERAEILAALANGAALLAIAGYIAAEAVQRFSEPHAIRGGMMLGVAAGGLGVNLIGLWLLHGGRNASMNLRGAWLHVMADAVGSVAAIAAAVAVLTRGWSWVDPAVSLAIAALVVYSATALVRQAVGVLMQAAPPHIDVVALSDALVGIRGVLEVHDLHVWSVTSGRDVMSAHLNVEPDVDRARVAADVRARLRDGFGIHHSTIQLDCPGGCAPCERTTSS